VPACLLSVIYRYGKPRLCINIHHYAPPIGCTKQHAAGGGAHRAETFVEWPLAAAGRGSVLLKVQCQVLNR